MKKTLHYLLIIFLATTQIQNLQAQEYTLTDEDVIVENGIIQSCSYNFSLTDIIIPDTLDGQCVTGIAGAFQRKGITSVKLPSTLLSIGRSAFRNNFDLSHIDWNSCTRLRSIAYYAFTWSPIDTIDLSPCTSLRSISSYAFRSSYLEAVILPHCSAYEDYGWKDGKHNTYTGGDIVNDYSTFYYVDYPYTLSADDLSVKDGRITNCNFDFSYKYIAIPPSIDGEVIRGISDKTDSTDGVFENKGLLALQLPETMETIGNGAFASNFLTSLSLGQCSQLQSIGEKAFFENDIDSLVISGGAALSSIGNNAFYGNKIKSLNLDGCSGLLNIGLNAFRENGIKSLDLSPCSSITNINSWAFYGNGIDSINFNGCTALRSIGNHSFRNNNFRVLNLSTCSSLNTIGEMAFAANNIDHLDLSGCTALDNIMAHAFYGNKLKTLDLNGCTSLMTISENAFNSNELSSFALPVCNGYEEDGWFDIHNNTYSGGDTVSDFGTYYLVNKAYTLSSDELVVEDGIIVGCNYDFLRNNIVIPQQADGQIIKGIANASEGVFEGKGIYFLELPATLEFIGNRAFANNILRILDLSPCTELNKIGKYAFYDNNIDSLDLSLCPGITEIGDYSFPYNNIKVLNLDACSSLTSIGYSSFYLNNIRTLDLSDCSALKIIKSESFVENHLSNIIFNGCTSLEVIDVYAFFFNNLTNIDLSSCPKLEVIDYGSFGANFISNLDLSGCTRLRQIGYESFHSNNLSSVDLSSCTSLMYIGWFAFDRNYMSSFTLPTPDYPGFEYWQDFFENPYYAGENVACDKEYRATDVYSGLTFSISDNREAIDSAKVNFNSKEYFSDADGKVTFQNILQGEYTYTVSAEGYEDVSGALVIGIDDVIEYVSMSGYSLPEMQDKGIALYPNPVQDEMFIEIPSQAAGGQLKIINSEGRLVFQQKINSGTMKLRLHQLCPGLYFYSIYKKDSEVVKTGKWIKL